MGSAAAHGRADGGRAVGPRRRRLGHAASVATGCGTLPAAQRTHDGWVEGAGVFGEQVRQAGIYVQVAAAVHADARRHPADVLLPPPLPLARRLLQAVGGHADEAAAEEAAELVWTLRGPCVQRSERSCVERAQRSAFKRPGQRSPLSSTHRRLIRHTHAARRAQPAGQPADQAAPANRHEGAAASARLQRRLFLGARLLAGRFITAASCCRRRRFLFLLQHHESIHDPLLLLFRSRKQAALQRCRLGMRRLQLCRLRRSPREWRVVAGVQRAGRAWEWWASSCRPGHPRARKNQEPHLGLPDL